MIAAVTLALWASGAAAQVQASGSEGASGQASSQVPAANPGPAVNPAPAAPVPGPTAPAVTPPAATAAPAATQQGTPATVLDTQDYESLLGRSVRSAQGDELGRVIDIIIDKEGHPRAAIIDFGGFLGVGTRKIAVDWRALRFTSDGGKERKLSVALTRNQVRVSPEYKSGEPIVVLGPASPAAPSAEGDQAAAPAAPTASPTPTAAPPTPPASTGQTPPAASPEKAPDK
ncbi:PRC-barrel domain-containing protein [Methylobacterium sp. E-005]|uniref:PRC-barrel domain-containing protein n=1 Tax=Methylobacterium sp. E-005 TaxID=2836549 RepID=UPI001FB8A5DA|nr:PRC-barrel domain-containing protein [Methylobacterium sp. E-005]MCJ2087857.1 PRC-barrel domain-containing protein [Methylobacterium sp. E-005]